MATILLTGIRSLLGIETAHAQVSAVINGLITGGAQNGINIIEILESAGRSLVVVVSVLMLVRAAAKMVGSVSEEKMEEGRRSVLTTVMGIILINLSYAMVSAFWNGGSIGVEAGAQELNSQVLGLVRWAQVLIGILAVLMIVISAFKVIASFGKEDAGDEMRRSVMGGIVGIFLVAFDTLIVSSIGGSGGNGGSANPNGLIELVMTAVSRLMIYLALLAVIIIVYGGIMMLLRPGSDEQYEKTKSLIGRVLIGLVIVLFSYFVVNFVVSAILG